MPGRVLVLAHRGLHDATRAENSIAAVRAAYEVADGVEVDIRETADGVLVLGHDPVTPEGQEIANATFADLVRHGRSRIATYSELLEEVPRGRWLFAEVKVPNVGRRVLELGAAAVGPSFRVGSFDRFQLRDVTPDRRWLLVHSAAEIPSDLQEFKGVAARADAYPLRLGPDLERAAWHVQPGEPVAALLSAGVQFLITDEPELVRAQVGA